MKFLQSKLAELKATSTQTADGITIKSATGRVGGVFSFNPDPADTEDLKDVPLPSWAAQQAILAWLTLDQQIEALGRNKSLSEFGINQQLNPAKERALLQVAAVANSLGDYEAKVQAEEVARYAVPQLNRADVVGRMDDGEIRAEVRALSRDERTKLLKTLATGSDEALSAAILRSPYKFGDLASVATSGWKELVDARDPVGQLDLSIKKQSIDWALRIILVVVGLLRQVIHFTREELFEIVRPQNGAPLFGFTPQEVALFERKRMFKKSA